MQGMDSALSPALHQVITKNCRLRSLESGVAEVTVENQVTANIIKKYALEGMMTRLTDAAGTPVRQIKFIVHATKNKTEKEARVPVIDSPALFTSHGPNLEPSSWATSNLNPKYTFETFIVGKRNQVANAAAVAVAEQPGSVYNPLYLYGGVGLGKTHLMQAIGNAILQRDETKQVLYVSSETFMNEFVASIRGGSGKEAFKKKYRSIDVLLIDDIQFIAGKDGTQEEFFHTFNALHQSNRQIVITSDQPPVAIQELEERLSSRFSMGMVANMQLPDLETRQAILMSKCQERGIILPAEALSYIANHIETNIRELEGALSRVVLEIHATGKRTPSLADVRDALRDVVAEHKPGKRGALQEWMDTVCAYYEVEPSALSGPRRQQEIVKPRQILMYLLKLEVGMTYPAIGKELGGRDHTTAMHSVEKIEKELKRSPELFEEIQALKERFYAHRG